MRGRHFLLASALLACGGGPEAHLSSAYEALPLVAMGGALSRVWDPTDADDARAARDVPYDEVVQKSIHNAYDRKEPLLDQLLYHRVRSLELDIHRRREGVNAPPGEWFVYHEDNPLMRGTSCVRLSDCLGQLAAFHEAVPEHEAVTLFIDLKTAPTRGHEAEDLDAAIARGLGRENIVTPADLVRACPGAERLRDAVTGACRFPALDELRGKFIVATTGGSACDASSLVSRYGGQDPRSRLAFVAPDASAACPVASYDARPDVVFFNMTYDARAEAAEARRRGLVARVYGAGLRGGLDDARSFASAARAGASHVVTNRVNFLEDEWTATHRASGFPFACDGCGDSLTEAGEVLAVTARSGDQEGSRDSAFYALSDDAGDTTWSALVSVPGSHVEPYAKACLVARASKEPDAENVSICRTFDVHGPRVQLRRERGGATSSRGAPSFDGVARNVPAFLRLAVTSAPGGGSRVLASASHDGSRWTTVASATVPVALPYRGVSVSSHGAVPVKALFANLMREQSGERARVRAGDLEGAPIGQLASGAAFDGIFAPEDRLARAAPSS